MLDKKPKQQARDFIARTFQGKMPRVRRTKTQVMDIASRRFGGILAPKAEPAFAQLLPN